MSVPVNFKFKRFSRILITKKNSAKAEKAKESWVYPSIVGVSNPDIAKITKLIIFQYSGNEFITISLVNPDNKTIGNWEILKTVVKRIVSKFKTSSIDHRFSNVFSP